MKKYMSHIAVAVLFVVGFMGCSSTKDLASENAGSPDITWLATSLQDEGVFIRERGSANLNIPAFESTRFVLNDREILDVYEFERIEDASSNAYTLANTNPGWKKYKKESLVVVRFSRQNSGLTQTLFKLLGVTL